MAGFTFLFELDFSFGYDYLFFFFFKSQDSSRPNVGGYIILLLLPRLRCLISSLFLQHGLE